MFPVESRVAASVNQQSVSPASISPAGSGTAEPPTGGAAAADAGWRRGLNAAQTKAVTHAGPALLVVAGAGTGKTGTLAARVAHLIESGVAPERILLLTFTRRAAREMLTRAGQHLDAGATDRVWGGTFHSVANRLLRLEGPAIGLPDGFTVLDRADSTDLIGLVRAEHVDVKESRFPRRETIAAIYERTVSTQRNLAEVVEGEFPWCSDHLESLPSIFDGYTRRKRAQGLLDYTDLLLFLRALLVTPGVGDRVAGRFDHVLVDEFQDTDPVQADIVHSIADRGAHLTVVGDDAQSIYGFRSATVENMWRFGERRAETVQVTLEDNYRSSAPVLDLANDLLAESGAHFEKRLRAHRPGGRRPSLITCHDEVSQASAVADRILELREEGIALIDQAVLFRTGHHSDLLELELGRRNLPYLKFGGLKFLEAAHVKDLLAVLRVLDNPWDQLAWSRVLRALPGVGTVTITRTLEALGVSGEQRPGRDPLRTFLDDRPRLPRAAATDAEELAAVLADCQGNAEHEPAPAVQVERIASWLSTTFERRYGRGDARAADLDQLQVAAAGYTSRSRFITELVLEPPASTGDFAGAPHLDDDYLTLSTVHSAKGGEWQAVHVISATDGSFPADMSLGTPEGLEEERRLMYVAVTRAKDVLTVFAPLRCHHTRARSDRHSYAQLSRFLQPLRHHFDLRSDRVASEEPGGGRGSERVLLSDEVDLSLTRLWSS